MMLLMLFLQMILFMYFQMLQTFYFQLFIHALAVLPITKIYLSPTHSVVKNS